MKTITSQELADRWGIREGTLRNWRWQKKGPEYRKIGEGPRGYIVYDLDSVVNYEVKYNIKYRRSASTAKPASKSIRHMK